MIEKNDCEEACGHCVERGMYDVKEGRIQGAGQVWYARWENI